MYPFRLIDGRPLLPTGKKGYVPFLRARIEKNGDGPPFVLRLEQASITSKKCGPSPFFSIIVVLLQVHADQQIEYA